MPSREWRNTVLRLANMDRHEILDRCRQALAKRADALLWPLGFNFGQSVIRSAGTPGCFFFAPSSVHPLLELLRTRLPRQATEIVRQADKICLHRFDLLG